jgi:hypothetical protein
MSHATVPCPYCGALIPEPSSPVTRLDCPRCGESFAYRPDHGSSALTTSPGHAFAANTSAQAPVMPSIEADPVVRWTQRRVLLAILGVMVCMAAISLTFALSTVQGRRMHDPKPLPTPLAVPVVPPVEWAGLSYLPEKTDIVVGVEVAQARKSKSGQAFLARAELGSVGFTLTDLEGALGLKLSDLDHVVLGVRAEDLRTVLVVRTRQPYDAAAVRTALKASKRGDSGNRDLYHFTLEKQRLSAVLWSPDENTLVLGLNVRDIAAIPSPPTADRLPAELADLLRKHTNPRQQFWSVGHFAKGDDFRNVLALWLGADEQAAVAAVRHFAFALELEDRIALSASVECTSEDGAAAVEKSLAKLKANDGARLKVIGPGPDGERVARALADSFRLERKEKTVELSAQTRDK